MTWLNKVPGFKVRAIREGLFALLALLCAVLAAPQAARADTPIAFVRPELALRFGTVAVYGSGTRTVTPAGVVSDSGLIPAAGDSPGPARFTVGYDRGNEGNKSITVVFVITFGAVPPVSQGGVSATVTNLTSDLAGASVIVPGQTVQITIANCRVRQCAVSFNVGGRLNVTSSYGGGNLSTPVPVSVTVVSVV
jgi:hypothetical protein